MQIEKPIKYYLPLPISLLIICLLNRQVKCQNDNFCLFVVCRKIEVTESHFKL